MPEIVLLELLRQIHFNCLSLFFCLWGMFIHTQNNPNTKKHCTENVFL